MVEAARMSEVIAVCGSYRSKSLNRKLFRLAVREATSLGLSIEEVDLKTLGLPVYDGDIEEGEGLPASVKELKTRIAAAPGLLIVSPEYNGSVPGGLKNFIDWLSRPPGNCFAGRVVSINNASDGAFGGARSTLALKVIFSHLGAWVVPGAMNLPKADQAFDEGGELKEAWAKKALAGAMARFAEGVRRMK
jgi:chromate reductase, NAD(P)H dehydrogenase (quinone)